MLLMMGYLLVRSAGTLSAPTTMGLAMLHKSVLILMLLMSGMAIGKVGADMGMRYMLLRNTTCCRHVAGISRRHQIRQFGLLHVLGHILWREDIIVFWCRSMSV